MKAGESLWPDPEPVDGIGLMPPTAGPPTDPGLAGADEGFGSGAASVPPAGPDDGDDHPPSNPVPAPEYDDPVEHVRADAGVTGAGEPEHDDGADEGADEAEGGTADGAA